MVYIISLLYPKRQSKAQDLTQYNLNKSKLFLNKYYYVFKDSNELNILDNYYSKLLINKKNFYTCVLDYFTGNLTHYLNFEKVEKIPNFNYYNFNFFIYNNDTLNNIVYCIYNISKEKNKHNSMRKSIPKMIRMQSNNAVCIPTNTRIHLLSWSKDVIHSWVLPSDGLKIDCIHVYSSHR